MERISDPGEIGFLNKYCLALVRIIHSCAIYYGKVKSGAGVSPEVENSGIVWLRFQLKHL